ncbi:MAG: nucleotidyltransferase family protein [Sneathiella sp.]|nr:nucleotidyltransferase family protein [Sneathiella sp.]
MLIREPDYQKQLFEMIGRDHWSMDILRHARTLDLPDWAIGAGFIRAMVWDQLTGRERTQLDDIDVLYFDPNNLSTDREKQFEHILRSLCPDIPWSVKNQARMHIRNKNMPYRNTEDAMRYWLETPTAVAVRLESDNQLSLLAPYGLNDLFQMIIRPTPSGELKRDQFEHRLSRKPWLKLWPEVSVVRDKP